MDDKERRESRLKDWITFLAYTIIMLFLGAMIGCVIGRHHPSNSAKSEWLNDVRLELDSLNAQYEHNMSEMQMELEISDSIISKLNRKINGEDIELPIVVVIGEVKERNTGETWKINDKDAEIFEP